MVEFTCSALVLALASRASSPMFSKRTKRKIKQRLCTQARLRDDSRQINGLFEMSAMNKHLNMFQVNF